MVWGFPHLLFQLSQALPPRALVLINPSWYLLPERPRTTRAHGMHTFLYISQSLKLGWPMTISGQWKRSRNNMYHFQVRMVKNAVCLPPRIPPYPHLLGATRSESHNTKASWIPLGGEPPRRTSDIHWLTMSNVYILMCSATESLGFVG